MKKYNPFKFPKTFPFTTWKNKNDLNTQLNEIENKEEEINKIKPKLSKLKVLQSLQEKNKELINVNKEKNKLIKILDDIEKFKKILNDNEQFYNDYSLLNSAIHDLQYAKEQFEGSRVLFQQYSARKSETTTKINQSTEKTKISSKNIIQY